MLTSIISILADTDTAAAGAGIGALAILFWVVGIALTIFWIWMVIDVATSNLQGTDKVVWVLVVVLLGWIGAVLYLVTKRGKTRTATTT